MTALQGAFDLKAVNNNLKFLLAKKGTQDEEEKF